MEETTVLIVGAGPSGLALAVFLARMSINVCSPDPNGWFVWLLIVFDK